MSLAIRVQLAMAIGCLVFILGTIAHTAIYPPGPPAYEFRVDVGTSCPRPCHFPQLEEARHGRR
jgi:hypothetical protein